MCSKGRPDACHRSKLIGEALEGEDIRVRHVDADGNVVRRQAILKILTSGRYQSQAPTFTFPRKLEPGCCCFYNQEGGVPSLLHPKLELFFLGGA